MRPYLFTIIFVTAIVWAIGTSRALQAQAPALKIVVLEGEDGVNIIQQKTAVSPVVEVRDRNDQPVAGAVVTFAIRSGRATFSGARTLTITTNAAGRAAAAGLTPTGSGALQISASAAFQGQTAAATIVQTNVMTAAQAANAGAAGAGGGGGGGGLGVGAISAIAGGAVGGIVGLQQYTKFVEGDPPVLEGATANPSSGIQNATRFDFSLSTTSWHSPDEGDTARITWEYGDGASDTVSANPEIANAQNPFNRFTHVYSASGTFTSRVTFTDHWDRTASIEIPIRVASLTGQWTSSASGGTYGLVQTGASISGTFTPPSGPGSGAVSGMATASTGTFLFSDPGTITLTLPTLVGSTIVNATFVGRPNAVEGSDLTNRLLGTLSGPGVNNSAVTLTRQ